MFVLYLKNQHLFDKEHRPYASDSEMFRELKFGIEILVGQAVFELWIKVIWINYSNTWPI